MNEREQLLAMLGHAKAPAGYQRLIVDQTTSHVAFSTGPDDAQAIFQFNREGQLLTVSVDES